VSLFFVAEVQLRGWCCLYVHTTVFSTAAWTAEDLHVPVTCIRSNSLGWNIVIQEISASNFCSLAVLGLRGKVSAVISEIAKANWMKNAHRKLRNECWYADVDVDGKVEIFVSNVGVAKGGYREGGSNVRIWKFNLQWSQVRKRGKIGLNQLLIYI